MPEHTSRRRRRRRRSAESGAEPRAVRSQSRTRRWASLLFKWMAMSAVTVAVVIALGIGYLWYTIAPTLPDVQSLREVQLQMPLRIYTADGDLIAEYGEKRREPVQISEVPDNLKNSIIASEDARFYEHPGVDWQGLARAGLHLIRTGRKGPGGSTITMQVARNFFLTNERTYSRKLTEIFLSFKIESELAKDEILELYLNKIYLGNRSYGFAAASKVYYGKKITELNLAEASMLAGLPKAPSRYNPIVNPERALIRRNYVLGRLRDLDMIDERTYQDTLAQADKAELHYARPEAEANYVGEMVRARVEQLFGNSWATAGFNVFTTIRSDAQRSANLSLRNALYNYESRHGYSGPITTLTPDDLVDMDTLYERLENLPDPGDLIPAAVLDVSPEMATVVTETSAEHQLALEDVSWARERINVDTLGDEITAVDEVLNTGDVIALQKLADGKVRFVQEPTVEAAFVAMDPASGQITALVGGYDYYRSKFNRATQARRQPGSTFKPFIYSAALEAGDTPATIYNDAPVVFHDAALEGEWRPSNYSGRFFGPTRLREALVKSRNLVSVRVLREIGIPYSIEYAQRFGFAKKNMQPDLSLALGSAAVTPIELASAFAVFANGGYKVPPHYIDRIEDPRGKVVYSTPQVVLCDDCNAFREDPENPLLDELDAEEEVAKIRANAEPEAKPASPAEEALDDKKKEAELQAAMAAIPEIDVVNAPRVIDERNAWIMRSMMQEVVRRGTARRAGEALGRSDLAGKTGTTNNQLDAWFAGFNSSMVAAAWIGSDGLDPLGRGEAGGIAALPMWTDFVRDTLDGVPEDNLVEPPGLQTVRIDRKTGEPSSGENTMFEMFMEDNLPDGVEESSGNGTVPVSNRGAEDDDDERSRRDRVREVEQLF